MAVSAGMALASTLTGVLGGTVAVGGTAVGIGLFGGTTLFAAAAGHFLVTTAMGAAINALAPKPSSGASGYRTTTTGSVLPHQVIYGKSKAYGVRVFDEATGNNNKFLHRVLVFAGHEVEEFSEIYINDEVVTLDVDGNVTSPERYDGKVRIKIHLGDADQVADSDLIAESSNWTEDHRLRGRAYLYVRFKFDANTFPNGIPELSAVIKGKKVYDPRSGTTVWTDNPPLCFADYITSEYALKESWDNVNSDVISEEANACEFYDYPTLTGDKRYTCNGTFTVGSEPYDIIQAILSSMGGMAWYSMGKWQVRAARWKAPVKAFGLDDLRGPISVNTRHSMSDNFNTVNGTFIGEESNWVVSDFTPVSNSAFVSADGGEEVTTDLQLNFTSTQEEARRIANIYLERNRQQLTVQASFGLSAFEVSVGDNIFLTLERFGWLAKEFEVVSWTFSLGADLNIVVNMTMREISESVFDDISDGAVYERDNTVLLSPFEVPDVGLDATARLQILKEKLTNIVSLNVTCAAPERVDLVEAQFKKSEDSEWKTLGTGELGVFEAIDLEDGNYDFRGRARNTFGNVGDWMYLDNVTARGLAEAPSNITGASFVVSGGNLQIEWDAIPDLDLSYYKVRHAVETSGATWGNSTTAVEKVPRPATFVTIPARSGTYMIRPYDKSGSTSSEYVSLVVNSNNLPSYTTTLSQDDSTFTGTKTGCSVDASSLIITDSSTAPSSATYDFSTYIDTGSARLVRSRIDAEVSRLNTAGNTFDDLSGNFDSLTGFFDDLSGDQDFDDTNLEFYISTTEDDPAGSPTWSDYKKFRVGDFYGRAFRFRVVLKSQSSNVTPAISSLVAYVEYN